MNEEDIWLYRIVENDDKSGLYRYYYDVEKFDKVPLFQKNYTFTAKDYTSNNGMGLRTRRIVTKSL